MKIKCKHRCFECPYEDCLVEGISSEERKEIRERDENYFIPLGAKSIVKQRPGRAKHRGKIVVV